MLFRSIYAVNPTSPASRVVATIDTTAYTKGTTIIYTLDTPVKINAGEALGSPNLYYDVITDKDTYKYSLSEGTVTSDTVKPAMEFEVTAE